MKVKYIGNYRGEASVNFKGVAFTDGQSTDVTEDWYKTHDCPKLEVDLADVKLELTPSADIQDTANETDETETEVKADVSSDTEEGLDAKTAEQPAVVVNIEPKKQPKKKAK
jgi:hypothetical protein